MNPTTQPPRQFNRYYQAIETLGKKPKTREYTTAIFSFLVISLFGWYAIRPTLQTILHLRREIQDKIETDKKMEEKISNLIKAQALYQSIQQDIPLLDAALPEVPSSLALVDQLKLLSETTSASVSGIAVSSVPVLGTTNDISQEENAENEKPTAKKLQPFTVTATIEGSYPQIKTFMEQVIMLPRIITVDTIDIQPTRDAIVEEGTPFVPIRLVVKLQSYYLGP